MQQVVDVGGSKLSIELRWPATGLSNASRANHRTVVEGIL
jgi:hypothetical protein